MEAIKGDGVIVEFGREFVMHTGHGAKGCLTVQRGDVDTAQEMCIYQRKEQNRYTQKDTHRTLRPQVFPNTVPRPQRGGGGM